MNSGTFPKIVGFYAYKGGTGRSLCAAHTAWALAREGRRVVVDDNLPTRAGSTDGTVYTTYLFGPGAFGKGSAALDSEPLQGGHGTEGVELARVPLDSDTVLINRRRYILHPRGVKFNSASVAGDSPTNAELETASNWTRVYENKNVRVVAVTHNN